MTDPGGIAPLADLDDKAAARRSIQAIFWDSADPSAPRDGPEGEAFFQRWCGVYLDQWPELVLVDRDPQGTVIGYLAGCLDSLAAAPCLDGQFSFNAFASFYAAYPAHLHINVDPAWRGRGRGSALLARFIRDCRAAGIRGIHLAPGGDARNRRFYDRNGFTTLDRRDIDGRDVVLLGA